MIFNLKATFVYKALLFESLPLVKLRRFFKILFLFLGFVLFLGRFALQYAMPQVAVALYRPLSGLAVLFLGLGVFFWHLNLFFKGKIKKPNLTYSLGDLLLRKEYLNVASFLSFDTAKACKKTFNFTKKNKLNKPPGFVLLYFVLKQKGVADFVFQRVVLKKADLMGALKLKLDSPAGFSKNEGEAVFEKVLQTATKKAQEQQKQTIDTGCILYSLAIFEKTFVDFLNKYDLTAKDIETLSTWYERITQAQATKKKFWLKENLIKQGTIGSDYASGFTVTLDKYATDLREKVRKQGLRDIIGHQKEIKALQRVLEKTQLNNALLVGEPGSGRRSIVEAVLNSAFLGKTSNKLKGKRFLMFDISGLRAKTPNQGEFEKELDACLLEAVSAGNVVLVINNFHNFVGNSVNEATPGRVDITAILSRYLSLPDFQVVGITSFEGLHNLVENNADILDMFEKIECAEISNQESLTLMQNAVRFFEIKYGIFISYTALKTALKLAAVYLKNQPLPESALQLLDEASAFLKVSTKGKVLQQDHIENIVQEKTGIPVGQVAEKEKYVLLNLENLLHQRIINQAEAVKQLAMALRRSRAKVNVKYSPTGSFLFLGPTGVGKTETAKALASIYFGSEKRIIRLDMSEFQTTADIKRLLGTQYTPGLLTTQARENPFSLLLLDEIEKASREVLNIFLQVLDEGFITDGVGRRVDMQNLIVIATSNAGGEIIREDIKQDKTLDMVKTELVDYLLKERVFSPEFINRFDAVVVFEPLSKQNLLEICHLMLNKIKTNLEDKGILFEITSELLERIVELSYNIEFGAREMKRVIQDTVENLLAKAIIEGRLIRGKKVVLTRSANENEQFIVNITSKKYEN